MNNLVFIVHFAISCFKGFYSWKGNDRKEIRVHEIYSFVSSILWLTLKGRYIYRKSTMAVKRTVDPETIWNIKLKLLLGRSFPLFGNWNCMRIIVEVTLSIWQGCGSESESFGQIRDLEQVGSGYGFVRRAKKPVP